MARFAKYFFACCAVVAVFLLLEFCKVYITETIYNRCIRSDYPMPSAAADLTGLAEVFLYFGLRPIAGTILIAPLLMLVLYNRLSAKTGFLVFASYQTITAMVLLAKLGFRGWIHLAFDLIVLLMLWLIARSRRTI